MDVVMESEELLETEGLMYELASLEQNSESRNEKELQQDQQKPASHTTHRRSSDSESAVSIFPDKLAELPIMKRQKMEEQNSLALLVLPQRDGTGRGRAGLGKDVSDLDVSPRILGILCKMKIRSLRDVLSVTSIDLRNGSLTGPEVDDLLLKVAIAWWDRDLSNFRLSSIRQSSNGIRFSVGCPLLDKLFRGGIISDQLTEIAGAAGTGKTQMCLQLALMAQLPVLSGGLGGETLYICTENFPSKRLKQITDEVARASIPDGMVPSMDRIYVENLSSIEQVETFLAGRVYELLSRTPIKLIIMDSIASVFRFQEVEKVTSLDRAVRLQRVAVTLRRLQSQYGVALVCSNQATTLIDNEVSPENRDETGRSMTVPALGISWANFVSTRVMLEKEYELEAESGLSVVRRKMKIVFSPSLPQTQIAFEVVERGVKGMGKVTVSF